MGEQSETKLVGWALLGVWVIAIGFAVGAWYLIGWAIGFF